MAALHLFEIVAPDGVEAQLKATTELAALRLFCAEGFEACGERLVRVRGDGLWFKYPEHQSLCAGRWTVCRQQVNGDGSTSVTIEIPEPDTLG